MPGRVGFSAPAAPGSQCNRVDRGRKLNRTIHAAANDAWID